MRESDYSFIILLADFSYFSRALYACAADDLMVIASDELPRLANLWHSEMRRQIVVSIPPNYVNPDLTMMLSRLDQLRNPWFSVTSPNSERVRGLCQLPIN